MKSNLIVIILLLGVTYGFSQKKMIVISPKQTQQAERLYNSGLEKFNAKSYDAAISDLQKSLEFNATLKETFLLLAKAQQANQQITEAVQTLLSYAEKTARKDSMFYLISKIYFDENDYEQTVIYADKAISEYNQDFKYPYLRGLANYNNQKYHDAIIDFGKALNLNNSAKIYNDRASAKKQINDFDGAIADYSQAIELNANNADYYNNRGMLNYQMENFENAIADFDKTIQLNENNFSAYNNRGIVKIQMMNYDDAIKDFNKCIEIQPNFYQVYSNKGYALYKQKKYDEAVQNFDIAIKYNSQYGEAYMHRGNAKELMRNPFGACEDWSKAAQLGVEKAAEYVTNQCGN